MDIITPEKRSFIMSLVHGKDTKPEIIVRKYLFSKGLRFRKNDRRLPGCPDIVFPKYKTVIFVNGCFWHGHEGCKGAIMPKSNVEYWQNKIHANIERDKTIRNQLSCLGWVTITVWECELKAKTRDDTLSKLYCKVTMSNQSP
ncbi:MAG: DNA mismatch endonuclease Vsr [Spirochaetales bacterium]|nr:DNA mismatch endonuclease Vsr [Spirochaetales bacterium]